MYLSHIILLSAYIGLNRASPVADVLDTSEFTKKITKSEDLYGEWMMVHLKPLYSYGYQCPSSKLKVIPVTSQDVNHWKLKCLHKMDISVLDETKFEIQVTFPDDFEERFSIIKREKNEDHILFPSCKFEKVEFVRKGGIKLWMATREKDGKKIPIAIQTPSWDPLYSTQRIINDYDHLYYFYC